MVMKKGLFLSLLVLAVAMGLLIGPFAGGVAAKAKEIKIGVIYPLSGAFAAAGRDLRNGAELALDVLNNRYAELGISIAKWEGIPSLKGAKIKLIFADHRGEPGRGADLAKRLIMDEKVVGLMGCYHSSVTKTVSAVAERYGVPMINGSSTSPVLTKRGFKWFWRTTPHDETFTKDLFEFLKGLTEGKVRGVKAVPKEEIKRIAYACENTEWGSSVAKVIEQMAKEYGFDVVKGILYSAKSPDLTTESQALVAAKPDCMLFASYISDAILFVRTLKSMKASPKVVWGQDAGFEIPDFRATLGKDVHGILTRTVFIPKVVKVKKAAGKINALFKKRYGTDLTGASGRAFVALQTWAHVLNAAGSTDPKAIQKAANELFIPAEELIMPWGGVKFDKTGQNVLGTGLIGQYQAKGGKVELEIVYPFDLATADMVYPFTTWK